VTLPLGTTARNVILITIGALILAAATQLRLHLGFTPVPLTGQTLGVLLIGAGFGPARGALAVIVYLAAGLVGAPVYTEGGSGFDYLLGPTGGYLVGFAVAAAVAGAFARRAFDRRLRTSIVMMIVSSAVIYAFGVVGLMLATGSDLSRAVALGVAPFLLTDALKVAAAAVALPVAWRLVDRWDA
jgi:biotin transport system substrate-specific component